MGDGRSSGGILVCHGHFDAIAEFDSPDELRQLITALQRSPTPSGGEYQFEDHGHGGGMRYATLGPDGAVSDRGEDAFDRVCRAQVHPVLGGKVVERQQGVLILDQAGHGGRILLLVVNVGDKAGHAVGVKTRQSRMI